MRGSFQRSLAFAIVSLAALLSGRLLAQADSAPPSNAATAAEQPEEVTVRGRKTMTQYRLELERARDDIFRIFNEANEGTSTDIRCKDEQPTGTRTRRAVCRSSAENNAHAAAGREFLRSLFTSSGGFMTNPRAGAPAAQPGATQANANIGTGRAQQGAESGGLSALQQWEEEWRRLLTDNRDLYNAVVKYAELEDEYAQARGETTAPLPDLARGAPAPQPAAPQCEASTLTEYSQRGNVAQITGTVGISNCPAGTTGGFTVVARVRNDAGEVAAIEFNETWERADGQDHVFDTEYPIGDNVFLQSVRVRNLTCTCAGTAQ
jgi:hypothetical protein